MEAVIALFAAMGAGIIRGASAEILANPAGFEALISGMERLVRAAMTPTAVDLPTDPARTAADKATDDAAVKAGILPPDTIR